MVGRSLRVPLSLLLCSCLLFPAVAASGEEEVGEAGGSGGAASLEVLEPLSRQLAVSTYEFGERGGEQVVVTTKVVFGTLVVEGDSNPGLDIATLQAPWKATIEELTNGLCTIISIKTNVQSGGATKKHRMEVGYRLLPREGQQLYWQSILDDSGRVNPVVWSVFATKCGACEVFGGGTRPDDWTVNGNTTATVVEARVVYPATFPYKNLPQTTTRPPGVTAAPQEPGSGTVSWNLPETTSAPGASTPRPGRQSFFLRPGEGAKITRTSECKRPEVVRFTLSVDSVAMFTLCQPVAFRADPYYVELHKIEDFGRTLLLNKFAMKSAGVTLDSASKTLSVGVADHLHAGLSFLLVLPENALEDVSGRNASAFYQSPVYSIPEEERQQVIVDEGFLKTNWRILLGVGGGVVACCFGCLIVCTMGRCAAEGADGDDKHGTTTLMRTLSSGRFGRRSWKHSQVRPTIENEVTVLAIMRGGACASKSNPRRPSVTGRSTGLNQLATQEITLRTAGDASGGLPLVSPGREGPRARNSQTGPGLGMPAQPSTGQASPRPLASASPRASPQSTPRSEKDEERLAKVQQKVQEGRERRLSAVAGLVEAQAKNTLGAA